MPRFYKFYLIFGCAFCAGVCVADTLDDKINALTQRRDELKLAISQCEAKTQKLKVAGISTLGATGIGIAGNVALYNKIQNTSGRRAGGNIQSENKIVLTSEEKEYMECAEYLDDGLETCDSLAEKGWECQECL